MNRRDFTRTLLSGLAGFTILPGANRVWKAERKPLWVTDPRLEMIKFENACIGYYFPSFYDFLTEQAQLEPVRRSPDS